jgi:hypothetical protein
LSGLTNDTIYDRSLFIENGRKAGYFEWLNSKGTNYTCYQEYLKSLTPESIVDKKIEFTRVIIYTLQKPFTFMYFYWTMLVFVIHRFNFKKPIMRLILYHFILRSLGDCADSLGNLYKIYFANDARKIDNVNVVVGCTTTAWHPLNWFITRQLGTLFWYTGEIIGDWYPLLRTRAVVKNSKSIWIVYGTCLIFNLTKLAVIGLHFSRRPNKMFLDVGSLDYESQGEFYNNYYIFQSIVIYASFLYDISVYIVLKKAIFNKSHSKGGFFHKFKNLSEYRMLISALVSSIFLPLISINIFMKFYYQKRYQFYGLNFDFEETRKMVTSVQYYMIFIDQILLSRYKGESSSNSNAYGSYNFNSNSNYNKTYPDKSLNQFSSNQFSSNQLSSMTSGTLRNEDINSNENYYNIGSDNKNYPNMSYNKVSNINLSNLNNNNNNSNYYFDIISNGYTKNNYNIKNHGYE